MGTTNLDTLALGGDATVAGDLTVTGTITGDVEISSTLSFDDGESIVDTNSNELVEFTVTAAALNHIGIANAGTGVNPVILAEGEADTGITFVNSEAEEILILDSIATSVNELTISSAATGDGPIIAATGGDANINISLTPKGTGAVELSSGAGILSATSSGIVPIIDAAAPDAVTDTAACSVANYYSALTTTGAATPTLADGTMLGQMKKIQMIVDGGDAVLTPANLTDLTTITFADVGDTAELIWDGSGWQAIALYNIVDGATAPAAA